MTQFVPNRRHVLSAGLTALTSNALGQGAYPNKTTTIIVPFAAGGSADIFARMVAEHLQKTLGATFIVENIAGGGSVIGITRLTKSAPDAYTLALGSTSGLAIFPTLHGAKLSYSVEKDIMPIAQVSVVPNVLVVNPDKIKSKSVPELITYLKANEGKISFGSAGIGTSQHLAAELFMQMTQTKMVHVPYRGSSQMVTDLLSGQIELAFDNVPLILPHAEAGKLKMLATCTANRADFDPKLPALSEHLPGFEAVAWHGFIAPSGTPQEIITRLGQEITAFMQRPENVKRMAELGASTLASSPKDFEAYIKRENAKWKKVIETANIKID
jgi:tripartite-type tricarboxylate transporter receptor subunit TctC